MFSTSYIVKTFPPTEKEVDTAMEVQLSIRLPRELREHANEAAAAEGATLAYVIRRMLKRYVAAAGVAAKRTRRR